MRIGVLTSSRADYGIYRPLLQALKKDDFFQTEIIAFGTHLSHYHGYSIEQIQADGFEVKYTINSLLLGDDENAIATAFALTALKFSDFWEQYANSFDMIFCLGDRFEMFAAVSAGIPFNIHFAHIHGGETTLGAIDNVYRHAITLASRLHFVSTDSYKERVAQILGYDDNIYTTGALSLDTLKGFEPLSVNSFKERWQIDLSLPSILITVHPETVNTVKNKEYVTELEEVLASLSGDYQLIITMPNADTMGTLFREAYKSLSERNPEKIILVENFGTESYFSCMKHVRFLLGNTSSGVIEAASFNKYVINIGDRQKGRLTGDNVLHAPIERNAILEKVKFIEEKGSYVGANIYWNAGAADKILSVLKNWK